MRESEAEKPLPPLSGASFDPTTSRDERPRSAPRIEGYEILGPLGEGGMGTVWRAVQQSARREVALKVLAFGSKKAQARFEREVELTARLEHPHIARVYDSGLAQGLYYYAMELIDGVALDTYVETHHLGPRQILELLRTVCQAVQHAHQRGIIHRDLKPSNILVTDDGQPHVLDFGLAKAFYTDGEAVLTLSAEGEVSGTPAYMSPEQAAGRVQDIDTRSDVYSLGVILFRLLTGALPHGLSGTRYEVLRRIAEEEVRRPREVSPDIDRELEALLLKALARDPDGRYASAGELAQDIDHYLAGDPLLARKPTTFYFLARRIRKYRVPVAVGAGVLAALVGLAAWAFVRIAQEKNRAEAAAASERSAKLALEARLLNELGRHAEAERLYRRILAERRAAVGNDDPATLEAASNIAVCLLRQRKHKKAEALCRATLDARRRALGPDHPDTITSMSTLAGILQAQGRHAEAEQAYREALGVMTRVLGKDHPRRLRLMTRLAVTLRVQGKYVQAERLYRDALRIQQAVLGKDHRRTLFTQNALATLLELEGKYDEAETLYRDLLGSVTRLLGQEHPFTLRVMDTLCSFLKGRGKYREARELSERRDDVLRRLRRTYETGAPAGAKEKP